MPIRHLSAEAVAPLRRFLVRLRKAVAAQFYCIDIDASTLPSAIADSEILVVRSTEVTKEALEEAGELGLVVRAGAGTNTIDVDTASARSVYVANIPGKPMPLTDLAALMKARGTYLVPTAHLLTAIDRLLPAEPGWLHEHGSPGHGRDHVLPALISPSVTVPVVNGQLQLGTWQSLVLVDTNVDNHVRQVRLSFLAG